jgi:ubiquinone/menaquinone biosynthesis C-methylase UbiE
MLDAAGHVDGVLNEVIRVLRPGGALVVLTRARRRTRPTGSIRRTAGRGSVSALRRSRPIAPPGGAVGG